jgi:RNA polymerase sigma-70 factor, ECF subfamily
VALDETAIAATNARVYGLAIRMEPSPRAEEIARGSRLEVWQTSTRFDADRSSPIAWIMALAHHRSVDQLRFVREPIAPAPLTPLRSLGRRARRLALQDRQSRDDLAAHAEAAAVRDALARLDPGQRDALELVYLERGSADRQDDLAVIMSNLVMSTLPRESLVAEVPAPKGSRTWPLDQAGP